MAQISNVHHCLEEDGMVKKVFVGSKKHALYFMLTLVVTQMITKFGVWSRLGRPNRLLRRI